MALEWSWWKDWWRLRKWRHRNHGSSPANIEDISDIGDLDECCCDECYGELSDGCDNEDGCMGGSDLEGEGKQVLVGVCAMAKKSQSKPMKEILTRLEEFEYIKILVFPEEVILKEPVEDWPIVDCLISFHSKGFPLDKAIHYANLRNPFIINNLPMQYDIQDRRRVYAILDSEGIEIPRYAVLDRDSADPKHHELVESEDHVEVNGVTFNKPFVEKPVSAEDHNIYIYYPTSAGGGSQRLFRKIGSRSSVYSPESRVRKTGSYIYEDFMPTDGTDVKVYTVGPDYAHAEARKSPALDGKVERDSEGKEIRYPVILSNAEKLISRKVCLAFKQTVCGFDLLRANGKSFVCDVNGFSFVKNSNKYYDDCAKILGNMILRELAPTLHIPWSVPFQLDDPPIVPTTFGKMMELRCVVAVIRHGDRTPKQKMKVEVRHPKFFEIFAKYDGYKHGHVKLKRPKQLQEILDTARSLLTEIQHRAAGPELEEKQGKLEQLKSVLEMYGHFSGINRKVQMKYQPRGRPRGSSSDDGNTHNRLGEPSLVLILKWGGELTPAGRIQAEELGRIFRCMYPGGQGRHLSGEYAGAQGLGLLRLHSTFRHDLKIYASDEGRVQMTAAAFAKGLLALEGELTPILVQMVKSANTNGLLDNDCDSSKYQNMVKTRLHELLQQDREFTREDREQINPGNALSINDALDFVKNPVKCCQHVQALIQKLMDIVRIKKDDLKTKDAILYHGETWELMGRRWGKIEKDFCTKNKRFDISKIPDIYDCIKYDLQHNNHTLQFDHAEELYIYAKYLADIVIPQEYGLTVQEKLTIGQGICTPLLKKIRADLQRNIEESGEETVNRLNPRYSHGVSSPGRHVRTRLYFTSESHVHSLLTVLRYGGLLDVVKDEQWRRAMEYVSMVSELNYMSQIVVMLYEDPTKDPSSEERFHVELHFSPGVNCCVQKNLPPGPGFRPHSRNESSHNLETTSQCSTRIEEEDTELGVLEDDAISPQQQSDSSPPLIETEEAADSTLDSPTTSRAIDMMDLDPNMMDEPYDSGFLQGSAPIPISARTVAGHEAARLGSQLAASQRQRREREASSICEPRARSYDHQRQDKPDKNDQAQRRRELDDMFYERVDNLVGSHSPRAISHRYSPSCLATPAGLSVYSSSPDLSVSLLEAIQPCTRLPVAPKRRTADFSPTRERKIAMAEIAPSAELSLGADREFWDFGETQLLEGSSTDERLDEPKNFRSVGKEVVDSGKESVESKMAPDLGEDRGEEPRGFFRSRKGALERSSSRNVPAVSKESSPEVASAIERSEPRAAPDSRTTSSYEPNSLTRRSRKLPEDRMSSPECDLEISSSRKVPAVSGVDSELPSKESSPQVVPVIERSEPRAAPDSRTTSSYEPNSLTRRSRKLPQDRMSSPECDLETSSSRKVPAVSGVDSELPSKGSSPQVVPLIERSEPRAAPDSRTTSSYERNSLMTRSPSCLGIPVSLPHSVSSPELPAPAIVTILESSGPLVTLHNKSLASTSVESPRTVSFDRADDRVASPVRCYCAPPLLDSCKLMPPLALRTSETKRYGRSKSALALPTVDDACGESPRRLEEVVRCPLEAPDFQRSPCQRCRVPSEATGHPPYPKAERSVSLNFEPNSGSSTLNPDVRGSWPVVPGSWDESPIRPAIEGSSFPPKILRSVSQTCPITSLHPDGCIRRASLTVPGSERPQSALDRSRSMSLRSGGETGRPSAYSTSLPSHPHPRHRDEPTFPGSKASEIGNRGDKWVESSNPQPLRRRSSLIVPTTGDEVSGSVFARRFRSLSPSPQTCHCYNCNVSTLIKQSLNLSPAERSNLQAYFDRSALGRSRSMSLRPDRETGHSTSLSSHPRPHHRDDPNFPGNESKLVDRVEAQRRSSLTVPASDLDRGLLTGDEELLGAQDRVFARRFRSLSPSPQTCLCYNCNVSTLIKQSVNLPPAERSNFQAYFDRSLSHKSINCSCYKLSVASAEASRRVSRSASPNSRDSREVLAGQASGHSFGRSLSCLDDFYCPENDNRRNLSAGICVHRIFDENSFVASLVSHRKSMRNCKFLERRRSTPHNLGSSSRNSCKLHGSVSSGPSSIRLNSGTDPRSAGLLSVDNPAKPGENTESNHFDLKKSAATGAISGPPDFGAVDLQVDHSNPLDESEASTVETPDSQRRSMRNGKFLERSRSTPQNLGSSSRNSRKLRGHLFSGPPLIRLASGTDPGSAGLLSVDHPAEPGDNTDSGYFDLEKSGSTGTMSGAPDFGVVDFPVRHSNPLDGSKPFTVETPVPSDHREESTTIIQADGKTPQESRHSNAESNPLFWYPVVSSLSVHRDRPDGSSGKCLKLIQQPDLVSIPREKIESLLLLPRQCSCPEISAESTQPQRTPRRFLSRQSSLETNASSSTFKTKKIIKIAIPSETANYSSADKKTGITQQQRTPRHFLSRQSSLDTNASSSTSEMKMTRIAIPSEIANYSLTDKKSETTRTRKLGLALLRQLSCPEIPADLACHLLARSLDSGESPNYSFADKRSETTRTRKLGLALLRQLSCPEIPADLACHLLARSFDTGESPTSLHSESSRYCQCTGNIAKSTLAAQSENPTSCCSCDCLYCGRSDDEVCEKTVMTHCTQRTRKPNTKSIVYLDTSNTTLKYQRYNTPAVTLSSCSSSSSSNPRLQTQRSFSSPDTRPSIIQQPDPTCTARRHRHSISGQMSYFKLLGYNVSKKLTGSANSLFSTAVISGSSSAPNLKDMVPPHASAVAAIEGFGGVPPIRPLETLHNALSLRQLDSFLDMMTSAPLFRTPASSPPKFPSPGGSIHGGSVVPNLSIGGINREYHSSDLEAVRYIAPAPIHYKPGQEAEGNDLRNQLSPISPNSTGWSSEPQSFISSEPSSPAPTSAGECSMSMSLVSIDGTQPSAGGPKFSTNPCLDIDFNDLCMSIDQDARGESRGSISYTDYYSNEDGLIRKSDFGNLRERAGRDEISQDSIVDEDEEHTLTLRQTEEEQKRDVKFIFEQSKDSSSSLVKPGSSYKKIGRFRVESMEITDEDVRIKEAAAAAGAVSLSSSNPSLHRVKGTSPSIHDKSRSTASIAGEGVAQDSKKLKGGFSSAHSRAGRRGKTIARSQSVSTPQNVSHKTDVEYSCQASGKNMGSFSTMSCEDLENWKLTAVSPPASSATAPVEIAQDEPILTLASSLNGSVTVGFNVQDSKKD